ncbi:MAG: hypothetical protein H7Y11_03175, partial [Armatimonadetes bacterium]|nr:hypothetical protein [Anaerolineae bacterium]
WAGDDSRNPPLSEIELVTNPRYLLIPTQTVEEYVADARAHTGRLPAGEYKTALQAALQQDEMTSDLVNNLRLLLGSDQKWQHWQRKQGGKRIRQWLESNTVFPL